MTETARERLLRLLDELRSGQVDVETFCTIFEHTYNMELDKRTLSSLEMAALASLFEEVIWYSPFPDERARVPNYKGEAEIRAAAESAARLIRPGTGN